MKPETLAVRCLREVADEGATNIQLTESQWVITLWNELKSVDRDGLLEAAIDIADSYETCHWQEVCNNKKSAADFAKDQLDESNKWGYRAHLLRKARYGPDFKTYWEKAKLGDIGLPA